MTAENGVGIRLIFGTALGGKYLVNCHRRVDGIGAVLLSVLGIRLPYYTR